jgi:hypothetical protein
VETLLGDAAVARPRAAPPHPPARRLSLLDLSCPPGAALLSDSDVAGLLSQALVALNIAGLPLSGLLFTLLGAPAPACGPSEPAAARAGALLPGRAPDGQGAAGACPCSAVVAPGPPAGAPRGALLAGAALRALNVSHVAALTAPRAGAASFSLFQAALGRLPVLEGASRLAH